MLGQAVDSLVFYPLAFGGLWTADTLGRVMLTNWSFKVLVEIAMIPFTYWVCAFLKQAEGVDKYDTDTHFTPFTLED